MRPTASNGQRLDGERHLTGDTEARSVFGESDESAPELRRSHRVGALEKVGLERQSAYPDSPLVEYRSDAVYVPAVTERGERIRDDERWAVHGFALIGSYPHRFWPTVEDARSTTAAR